MPVDAFTLQPFLTVSNRRGGPPSLQIGLESEERHAYATADELAKVRKDLTLHERLFQAEVADVKDADAVSVPMVGRAGHLCFHLRVSGQMAILISHDAPGDR
jgi:hypothetical protein